VGAVQSNMAVEAAQEAYAADVTYVTGQELCFNYLRDNTSLSAGELVRGGECVCGGKGGGGKAALRLSLRLRLRLEFILRMSMRLRVLPAPVYSLHACYPQCNDRIPPPRMRSSCSSSFLPPRHTHLLPKHPY
jgi:hypothetical protein